MRRADPTVSGGMLLDARPDFMYGWRAGVAIAIPLFTRHTAEVQVETARVAQLRAQRDARVATLTGDATRPRPRAHGGPPPVPALSRRNRSAADDDRIHGRGLVPLGPDEPRGVPAGAAGARAKCAFARPMPGSSTRPRSPISSGLSEDRFDDACVATILAGARPGPVVLAGCHQAAPDETETETAVAGGDRGCAHGRRSVK